jgi:hypothetical protein
VCQPADQAVDVLVGYSLEFIAAQTDPVGYAQTSITQANRSFEQSQVATRLNLAGAQSFNYHQTGNLTSDLNALKAGQIGVAGQARLATSADVVVMLVHDDP